MRKFWALAFVFVFVLNAGSAFAETETFDPVSQDIPAVDEDYPPATVELSFDSDGERLNGHLYQANGPGPHPTAVLLHGYPGNEKNLDLAQALRRAGLNVLFFHYRGAWGSEGEFSFSNVIDDVGAALTMIRNRAALYRIDTDHLVLVGHSMGGFAALQGAARDEGVRCVAGLAVADIGARAATFDNTPGLEDALSAYADNLQMLAGWSGDKAIAEVRAHADAFTLRALAPSLSGKSILLVAADQDTVVPIADNHAPIAEALKADPSTQVTDIILSGDHSFSWTRTALIHTVVDWAYECADL